ncbi:MAG TPA: hypothetical protein VK669_01800 [Candidatus Limnocylindrales bacterium]|nr:hypothetical protein [Candidatus Limnocylindrales bacterium]
MTDPPDRRTAAYLPWKTLLAFFGMLSAGIPHRIDRSMFPKYSGGVIAQILVGLRFLGLVDDDGSPSALLRAIVAANGSEDQKALLRQMIEAAYPDLIALDLTKLTRQMFEQKLGEYGLTGSTRRKGARFFLNAADYVGLPLSPWLAAAAKSSGNGSSSHRPAKRRRVAADLVAPSPPVPPPNEGASVSVQLRSGGRLTLAATVNFMTLTADDRAFVFDVIDRLNGYPERIADPEASTADTEL